MHCYRIMIIVIVYTIVTCTTVTACSIIILSEHNLLSTYMRVHYSTFASSVLEQCMRMPQTTSQQTSLMPRLHPMPGQPCRPCMLNPLPKLKALEWKVKVPTRVPPSFPMLHKKMRKPGKTCLTNDIAGGTDLQVPSHVVRLEGLTALTGPSIRLDRRWAAYSVIWEAGPRKNRVW